MPTSDYDWIHLTDHSQAAHTCHWFHQMGLGHLLWVPCRNSLYLPILVDLTDTRAIKVVTGHRIAIVGFARAVHAEHVQDPNTFNGQAGTIQVPGSSATHFRRGMSWHLGPEGKAVWFYLRVISLTFSFITLGIILSTVLAASAD